MHMAETVLVTGGFGYVAGWCIVALLKRSFTVRYVDCILGLCSDQRKEGVRL
jgi:UDP-glucose 4-epimerase